MTLLFTVPHPGQPERVSAVTPSILSKALAGWSDRIEAIARIYRDDPVVRVRADATPIRAWGFALGRPRDFSGLPLPLVSVGGPLDGALAGKARHGGAVSQKQRAKAVRRRGAARCDDRGSLDADGAVWQGLPGNGGLRRYAPADASRKLCSSSLRVLGAASTPPSREARIRPIRCTDDQPAHCLTCPRASRGRAPLDLQPGASTMARLAPFQAMRRRSQRHEGRRLCAPPIADIHFGPPDDESRTARRASTRPLSAGDQRPVEGA